MRKSVFEAIAAAAVAAGLPEASVFEGEPERPAAAPDTRIEVHWLDEKTFRTRRLLGWRLSDDKTYYRRTIQRFRRELPARVVVRGRDSDQVDTLANGLLAQLPSWIVDANDCRVDLSASKAALKGFDTHGVPTRREKEVALHLVATGMIVRQEDCPVITDCTAIMEIGGGTNGEEDQLRGELAP